MALLSPALARRVDRLARRAHAFHRWAHHPLCDRYAGETVWLGRRTRLCRGCLLAAAGAALGLAAGAALPPLPGRAVLAAATAMAVAAPLAVRGASRPAGGRRPPKLLTRLLPMAVTGLAVAQARAATPAALAAAAIALGAVAAALVLYRRRTPDRRACLACPEGPPSPACAGFARQWSRERALRRLAGRWIAAEQRAATATAPPAPPPGTPGTASPRSASGS